MVASVRASRDYNDVGLGYCFWSVNRRPPGAG